MTTNNSNDYSAHLVGSQAYSQSVELLAQLTTLIGTTTAKRVAMWLERSSNTTKSLRDATLYELTHEAKIPLAKAEIVLAAIRLGKSMWLPTVPNLTSIDSPESAAKLFSSHLSHLDHECIAIACLDSLNRVLHVEIISIGTHDECLCDPKIVFRTLLKSGATRYMIAHNHPTGDCFPSPEDLTLTENFLKASQIMNLALLDHLIIGNGTYTSLRITTSLWGQFPQGDN